MAAGLPPFPDTIQPSLEEDICLGLSRPPPFKLEQIALNGTKRKLFNSRPVLVRYISTIRPTFRSLIDSGYNLKLTENLAQVP